MTLKDSAWQLRQKLGRPDWLVSIGVMEHLDTIVLYLSDSKIPPEAQKLLDDGWNGSIVIARVVGGVTLF